MSQPDYTDAQLDARSAARDEWAAGTRVRHAYGGGAGTVVTLHTGTLKRPRGVGQWHATVDWDRATTGPVRTRHALNLLRHDAPRGG